MWQPTILATSLTSTRKMNLHHNRSPQWEEDADEDVDVDAKEVTAGIILVMVEEGLTIIINPRAEVAGDEADKMLTTLVDE
jgi:hypothetical protein